MIEDGSWHMGGGDMEEMAFQRDSKPVQGKYVKL